MPIATDDSGPAATNVSPKLLGLRQLCDDFDIKWHWRHKESTLEGLIKDKQPPVTANETETIVVDGMACNDTNTFTNDSTQGVVAKREIPQDVLDALAYCNSYHRANTARIKEYIESIL